jgi:ankyrin repeat protein
MHALLQADSGLTPLLAAAKAGNSKAVHYLLEKGANTAARDVRNPFLPCLPANPLTRHCFRTTFAEFWADFPTLGVC